MELNLLKYLMNTQTNKILIFLVLILIASCKEKSLDANDDFSITVINQTNEDLPKVWICGASGTKSWYFPNIKPGSSVKHTFSLRKDFNVPDGDITITIFTSLTDSTLIQTGYFKDYKFQGPKNFRYAVL